MTDQTTPLEDFDSLTDCEGCRCNQIKTAADNFTDDGVGFCEPCWDVYTRDMRIEQLEDELHAVLAGGVCKLLDAPTVVRKWRKAGTVLQGEMARDGWPGAWDALKAAITGKRRAYFAKPLSLTLYVSHGTACVASFTGAQLEVRP